MTAVLTPAMSEAQAQTTRQTGQQGQQQAIRQGQQSPPPGGRGGRENRLPPISPNMNQQQLQSWIDTFAVVQAERDLQLTGDQYATFIVRLRKLQDVRRRHQMEKGRLMRELNQLLNGSDGRDEAILAHVKSLDDLSQRSAGELKQAYSELDSGLTPWQRGRYRMFEEQLERRKLDLLSKINTAPAGTNPGRGGGLK